MMVLFVLFAFQLVSAELIVEEERNDISSVVKNLLEKVHEHEKLISNLKSEMETMRKKYATCCPTKKKETPPGKTKEDPAKSCKWLKEIQNDVESGLYWISLKEPTQVYCDMRKEYGGGWTLIGKAKVSKESEKHEVDCYKLLNDSISNLRFAQFNRFLLSGKGLRELQSYINFTQIRFFCHKPWHGRTVHIRTVENELGKGVVDLMTERTEKTPKSCGSYERFEDDTSFLGRQCDKWYGGEWYNGHVKNIKMYSWPFYILGKSYFSLYFGDLECDDVSGDLSIGEWAFYVR